MNYGNEFEAGIGYGWIPGEKTVAGRGAKKLVKMQKSSRWDPLTGTSLVVTPRLIES